MRLPIVDGRHNFRATQAELYPHRARQLRQAYGLELAPMSNVDQGPALPARVNWNRWIVECPDCHNAEFGWADEPIFMCTHCWNAAVGGRWRRVVFPDGAERGRIEAALLARPVVNNRNWEPGESVGRLRAENRRHGLPEEAD